jgi:hypothetical protein
MNKLCHFIVTACILAIPHSISAKLKLKPSLSISLNKKSVCTEIESKYYLDSLQGATGEIKNFANHPFGDLESSIDNNYKFDDHIGPGVTYIDTEFNLKKPGKTNSDAAETDAISGDKLTAILTNADAASIGLDDINGLYKIPIESTVTENTSSVLTFYNISTPAPGTTDGIISNLLSNAPTYRYLLSGTDKLLNVIGDTNFTGISKYYTLDASKKYYIVYGHDTTPVNNIDNLLTKDFSGSNVNYTQNDYEYLEYYGITLAMDIEYQFLGFMFFNAKTDITTPVEKMEHTGKFVTIKPELDMSIKAGLSFGNENGSVGFLAGMAYDRFSSNIKFLSTPVGEAYLQHNLTQLKAFTTCHEIVANIRLSDQLDIHFNTVLTSDDHTVDLKGSDKRSPMMSQRFSVGLSMNN